MSLFVPVSEPDKARKELLFASKSIISVLRRQQEYNSIRSQKQAAIHEFLVVYHDLAKLMRKLRTVLPKAELPKRPIAEQEEEKPAPKPAAPVTKHKTKVDILEDQLSKIEKKLAELQ